MDESKTGPDKTPLCVDLDGTILRTDLMWECICALLRSRPWRIFILPLWWARGRPYLKAMLAREGRPDLATLPIRQGLLDWLRTQAQSGRRLLLISGSHHWLVKRMADRFGVFHAFEGTRRKMNLSGRPKAEWLALKFGDRGFDYAGDRAVDAHVWRRARVAMVVDAPPHVQAMAKRSGLRVHVWREAGPRDRWAWGRALRIHQWLKNLLVFTPILTSHRWGEAHALLTAAVAFASFSLIASALYILNDLVDLVPDRLHADKRSRPFANGTLMIRDGLLAIPLLLVGGGALASILPDGFGLIICAYVAVSCCYSLLLKRLVLLDALALTLLYVLRIEAGGVATGIGVSRWLMLFAVFLFLSLALAKRYAELRRLGAAENQKAAGRGYRALDLGAVGWTGMASGLISVLVVAMYIGSPAAALLYREPAMLWLECPILVFWIGRLWLMNRRGDLNEDPVRFVAHDAMSYIAALLAFAVILLAR